MTDTSANDGWISIPVSVLTGFLGSGKTTLLSKLLRHPGMGETAVLINEFGEIGLDHDLLEKVDNETVLMSSGCLCCTIRGDLVNSLRSLYFRRVRGEVPPFKRVVIETTGLADPAPILHTLMEDPIIEAYFRLDSVVTTVDAVNGQNQLDSQFESVKQAAVADRIILTKTDMPEAKEVARLEARLHKLNPAAPVLRVVQGDVDPAKLFNAGLYDPKTKTADVQGWLRAEAYEPHGHDHAHDHGHDHHHHHHDHDHGDDQDPHDVNRHDKRITATCLTLDEPIDWDSFSLWLGSLARYRGEDLLRIKGILNVAGEDRPVAIHGVQHLFHPPARLPAWPSDDRRSRIVFITRDIDRKFLEDSLASYKDPAKRLAEMRAQS
ncbi:MAG: GTP-binding protein, partial [Alphaproteobacteria bacterium]|nr:GTP-binding protein [Alphaproteobacteria bacterium]